MPPLRVLVSGASVAGPTLAYWLARAGCKVTVVERAPSLRRAGQGLDVRDTARDVVKRMGIFDRMLEKSSHEEGVDVVDKNNRSFAHFVADQSSGKGDSFSCDIEILRGDLAQILVDVTKDDVSYIFGDMVQSLDETEKGVSVNFANGTPRTAFDLVIAADGLGSKIRAMTFDKEESQIKSLNSYVSYFAVQSNDTDSSYAKCHWIKGGRFMVMRPDNLGRRLAFLGITCYDNADNRLAQLAAASKQGIQAQKGLVQELFKDADWELSRIMRGLQDSDENEFYLQHIAQVKLKRWSKGRVAMVGDAAYAPSPFTGMGTSLSFIGAYILAGEISRQPDNVPAALESYEKVLRPYVEGIQYLLPGVPYIFVPQSALGVKIFETCAWAAGKFYESTIATWFGKAIEYFQHGEDKFKLPDYEAFKPSEKMLQQAG